MGASNKVGEWRRGLLTRWEKGVGGVKQDGSREYETRNIKEKKRAGC